jgi:GGDEF domain-containing protein
MAPGAHKAPQGRRSTSNKAKGPPFELTPTAATCVDAVSGLYHPEHFRLTLNYEFGRMDRTEKPLGLVLVCHDPAEPAVLKALGALLKRALRPLDLAARLGEGEVAILMPEAQRDRAVHLLIALGKELNNAEFGGLSASFGAAIARPYQGLNPEELLRRARENTGSASEVAQKLLSGASPWAEIDTALDIGEKESLFDGFSVLSSPRSSRGISRRS